MPDTNEMDRQQQLYVGPVNKKNTVSKALDITNTGRAPYVVHDFDNQPVTILPGETKKVEMHGGVADIVARGSDMNGPLQVGERAKRFLEMQRWEQENAAKDAKEKAERDNTMEKERQKFATREITAKQETAGETQQPRK